MMHTLKPFTTDKSKQSKRYILLRSRVPSPLLITTYNESKTTEKDTLFFSLLPSSCMQMQAPPTMASLHNSPTIHATLFHSTSEACCFMFMYKRSHFVCCQDRATTVRFFNWVSFTRPRRRQVISIGATTTAPLAFLLNQHSYSLAAEDKKGFLSVLDKKDGYSFLYPFGWQAPNYTRHALSTVSIGNGKFYTLTTGANERKWEKMKDRFQTVIESFRIFNV